MPRKDRFQVNFKQALLIALLGSGWRRYFLERCFFHASRIEKSCNPPGLSNCEAFSVMKDNVAITKAKCIDRVSSCRYCLLVKACLAAFKPELHNYQSQPGMV